MCQALCNEQDKGSCPHGADSQIDTIQVNNGVQVALQAKGSASPKVPRPETLSLFEEQKGVSY